MFINLRKFYRYPVKGLSGEPLQDVELTPGLAFPQDRRFALARPGTRFDPERPEWLPKTDFFVLLKDERLAALASHFDAATGTLTLRSNGQVAFAAAITDADGRADAERFFTKFLGLAPGEGPRLVEAPRHVFMNASQRPDSATFHYISLINLASLAELERAAGRPLDLLRFRANIYFDGPPAWSELDWTGHHITIGDSRLRVVAPTVRCAATEVNPVNAERDCMVPQILRRSFGHLFLGVYAEVVAGGEINAESEAHVAPAAQ